MIGTKEGLTAQQVIASRQRHGENVLTPPRRQSLWRLYLEKYEDPMVRILLVAALVSVVLAFVRNDFVETLGIVSAIILATTVGFYFERDVARRFDVLTRLDEEQRVKVVRRTGVSPGADAAGVVVEVARREVVVGDVVIVETGDEVPADGRLFEAVNLQVDESSLTGEILTTKSIEHSTLTPGADAAGVVAIEHSSEAYPKDMLLRSSMVMNGLGRYVVTAVGDETEIGHVARQATELTGVQTPLNRQLEQLAKLISRIGGGLAIASFVLFLAHDMATSDLWRGGDYLGMLEVVLRYFMMAVTLIVMAVPEGLPMAVTLSLALNMRRMLKSNNLVRKLQASETMGAITTICTDKTGTLTENRMTVFEMRNEKGEERVSDADLAKAIALNTTATHEVGNPTEQALLRWLLEQGVDYERIRRDNAITSREPFSTERKYMSTTVGDTFYVKGAPEVVLEMLKEKGARISGSGEEEDLRGLLGALREWQRHAMRTLAIAAVRQPSSTTGRGVALLAIVAISDPLRQEVPSAIRQCEKAGIEVKIVTGDTAETALEIARQAGVSPGADAVGVVVPGGEPPGTVASPGADAVGVVSNEKAERSNVECVTGSEFAAMSDEEALRTVGDLKVLSRARPADKQRLVALLQQRGEIVAVTGDGTNDAPALNRAHVGLSLGSGTSVAKQASDITLLDDSFNSIVQAVMWGRSLYKNIQRFIFFQLIVNVTALLLVLGGSVVGTEMPLTITQILWVNLIMDTFAAMALASLPPSREVLNERPRSQEAFIISRPMAKGIAVIGGLFFVFCFALLCYFERNEVVSPAADAAGVVADIRELTVFFTIFVMLQWWNLFNARTLGSTHSAFHRLWSCRGFLLVLALVLVGQWLIVTFGGQVFRTVPLSWQTWLYIIIGTSPVLWIGEAYRKVERLRK